MQVQNIADRKHCIFIISPSPQSTRSLASRCTSSRHSRCDTGDQSSYQHITHSEFPLHLMQRNNFPVFPIANDHHHNSTSHHGPQYRTYENKARTFQNCFVASFPAMRFRILLPPGCSSMKPDKSYTFSSILTQMFSGLLCADSSEGEIVLDILNTYH